MVFITFFGESKLDVSWRPGALSMLPLVILALFSIIGGFVELPDTLGGIPYFSSFLRPVFPATTAMPGAEGGNELTFQVIASLVSLAGILTAYLIFLRRPQLADQVVQNRACAALHRFWSSGWGFDRLYDALVVRPFLWAVRVNKADVVDFGYAWIAAFNRSAHSVLSSTQTGSIRWYTAGIAVGAVIFLGIVLIFH